MCHYPRSATIRRSFSVCFRHICTRGDSSFAFFPKAEAYGCRHEGTRSTYLRNGSSSARGTIPHCDLGQDLLYRRDRIFCRLRNPELDRRWSLLRCPLIGLIEPHLEAPKVQSVRRTPQALAISAASDFVANSRREVCYKWKRRHSRGRQQRLKWCNGRSERMEVSHFCTHKECRRRFKGVGGTEGPNFQRADFGGQRADGKVLRPAAIWR